MTRTRPNRMATAGLLWAAVTALWACGSPALQPEDGPRAFTPRRIISVDYCADQYVLKFAKATKILALSPDAEQPFSYMRAAAAGIRQVPPRAEDVLILKPDLVVRAYGGGANFTSLMKRAGVPVQQVPFAQDVEGIQEAIRELATALGATQRGLSLVRDMDRRLSAITLPAAGTTALYVTPAGVTAGPGTLVHDLIEHAGLTNFQDAPGWRPIPLERLAYDRPDVVITAFTSTPTNHVDAWSAMRHPIARRQTKERPTVQLDPAWTACGAWFLIDAIEALAAFDEAEP